MTPPLPGMALVAVCNLVPWCHKASVLSVVRFLLQQAGWAAASKHKRKGHNKVSDRPARHGPMPGTERVRSKGLEQAGLSGPQEPHLGSQLPQFMALQPRCTHLRVSPSIWKLQQPVPFLVPSV